jgi:spoIIIJ-associated protein
MNAYERKIVHDAVGTVEGASSFSEGEEPNRKVIVRGA